MAVRRLKGLYLKSEGKYLEDYPSCYVEQTEALFEWRQSTPKQDIELHKRAEKFSGLFRDMLLDKDKTLMVLAKVTVPEAAEVVGMVDIPQPMERDLRVPVVLVTHIKI